MRRWRSWALMMALVMPILVPATLLPLMGQASTLEPLSPGWDWIFKIQWDATTRRGKPVLEGYLTNDSPYTLTAIKLLAESLDAQGGIVSQRVDWVPGTLTPFSRTYFSVSAPQPSTSYRIRVFAFDRVEGRDGEFR